MRLPECLSVLTIGVTSFYELLRSPVAAEQNAEELSSTLGLGVSADHEFLLQTKFDFDPCSATLSRFIPGTAAFADQTFESELLCPVQKLWDIFCEGDRIRVG